jgi:hypothetical protein
MDQATTRFLAEVAARRSLSRAINAKAENKSGMLRGNGLYGDNGTPTPKSGKKAKLALALPRGKADLEAQARRAARQADRLTGPFPWRIDDETRKQCEAMPKDDVVSSDVPMRNSIQKFTRELRLDGGDKFSLPGGKAIPIQRTRGKAIWTESPGYVQAVERADLLIAPKTVKPRPDRQNRPKREVLIVHKSVKVKNKA